MIYPTSLETPMRNSNILINGKKPVTENKNEVR